RRCSARSCSRSPDRWMKATVGTLLHERTLGLALASSAVLLIAGRPEPEHLHLGWSMAALFVWLFGTVLLSAFDVVRHAEALAHRYGEPAGTLILTLSAVGIEVIMIGAM